MRVVHLLRKCDPTEWGGTEMAIQRLIEGLRQHDVDCAVYCPRLNNGSITEPFAEVGCEVTRFHAFLPMWGISPQDRQQFIAVGGNLMSFGLVGSLWRERDISVIHTHTLGRLGGIASIIARQRDVPFVVTIHGGLLDLPEALKDELHEPPSQGWDWGKPFGFVLRSRHLLDYADAILTCNPKEAALLREQYPTKRILVQPHGVATSVYRADHRPRARAAFPQIRNQDLLLCVGRIDPVKNQGWLIQQAPALFERHPRALLALVGACTDERYGDLLARQIVKLGLTNRVLLTGGLPPNDPRLIGLFQEAKAVLLPSISETFGLVILEAWAAGAPIIASQTSGALSLVQHQQNGWLVDLDEPRSFHRAVDQALWYPEFAAQLGAEGNKFVAAEFDQRLLAGRLKDLYVELIEEKDALRHPARRRHECPNAG